MEKAPMDRLRDAMTEFNNALIAVRDSDNSAIGRFTIIDNAGGELFSTCNPNFRLSNS